MVRDCVSIVRLSINLDYGRFVGYKPLLSPPESPKSAIYKGCGGEEVALQRSDVDRYVLAGKGCRIVLQAGCEDYMEMCMSSAPASNITG